ncbi:LPXTG cell wall anchor domain-containing protein [Streptacidiphilus sp. PAMC 29251]
MPLRRTSAAVSLAALSGLAVLGTASSAVAAAATVPSPPSGICKTGTTGPLLHTTLTGLSLATLQQGGPAKTGTVKVTNDSGSALKHFSLFLAIGQKDLTGVLSVSESKDGGAWGAVKQVTAGFYDLENDTTLAKGATVTYTLKASALKNAPAGAYGLVVEALGAAGSETPKVVTPKSQSLIQGANQAPAESTPVAPASPSESASASTPATPPTAAPGAPVQGGGDCVQFWGGEITGLRIVKAPGTPSASPTQAPSATASPTGPVLATTGGGSNTGTTAAIAAALVLAGGVGVVATRRRKRGVHS